MRIQSLSLLVFNSFCYLSSSIHVQAPFIHCVVDLSLQIEADSLFTGLAFPAELSNYICYCTWSLKPLEAVLEAENFFGGAPSDPPSLTVCYNIPSMTKTLKNATIVHAPS